MSNTDKLREIAEGILSDLFEAGMDAQEVGMPSFDMLKTSGYIDRKLSDLTALISEHYYPKEFTMWCIRNVQYCRDMRNEWYQIKREGILVIKTLDEVYNYWEENER